MGELCAECRNWHKPEIYTGEFRVINGVLEPVPFIPGGAYIRIVGSTFNDGVWKYPHGDFADETFRGAVWLMHVPVDFENLLDDINAWEKNNAKNVERVTEEVVASPFTSESFAGYTYTRKTGIGDIPTTWKDPRLGFSARLNAWRKV
jgi:hypothetical protein